MIYSSNNESILVIDDMYSNTELSLIWKELDFLTSPTKLQPPSLTGAAVDKDNGEYAKTGDGVFLDTFYADRQYSDILKINRKIFDERIIQYARQQNIFFGLLSNINRDHTLINYYDQSQGYKLHADKSVFTAVTLFYKEPVHFTGGDWNFPEIGKTVEKKNNRMVLFPGSLKHAIDEVQMIDKYEPYSGNGRYAMVQFLNVA